MSLLLSVLVSCGSFSVADEGNYETKTALTISVTTLAFDIMSFSYSLLAVVIDFVYTDSYCALSPHLYCSKLSGCLQPDSSGHRHKPKRIYRAKDFSCGCQEL